MEVKCIKTQKELPYMDGFKKSAQPLIEWVNKTATRMKRLWLRWDMRRLSARKWDSRLRFQIDNRRYNGLHL